ncbi:MAG: double zinc ribbon domain-containing protein [Holosporales bacterium]
MLKALGYQLLNYLLPPRCAGCGALVDEAHRLCAPCYHRLTFITDPQCACCGFPFPYAQEPGSLCAACAQHPPLYHQARAVVSYDGVGRELILRLKHGDATHLAETLAPLLAGAGKELLSPGALLVPVPIHPGRLLRRRYNQAALLCTALSKLTGLEMDVLSLKRVVATPSQGGLNRTQRYENVKSAFAADPHRARVLKNKKIILVDDVLTTGATVSCATAVLLKAGAKQVDVLTFARVTGPSIHRH